MAHSIPVVVTERAGIARNDEPVRSGLPLPRGTIRALEDLVLVDETGQPVAAQFESLSRWEDGSQRWVLLNFLQSIGASETRCFELKSLQGEPPAPLAQKVSVTQADDRFCIDTGKVKFQVPIYGDSILADIERLDQSGQWRRVSEQGLEAVVWSTGVMPFKSYVENCVVESAGPLKAVLKIEGHHRLWDPRQGVFESSQDAAFAFVLRVFCWAGSDEIRLQYTFINDTRDQHVRPSERYHVYALEELRDYEWANGRWVERPKGLRFREKELLDNDYGQLQARTIRLRLHLDDPHQRYAFGVEGSDPVTGPIDGPVALQQVGPVPNFDQFYQELPFPHVPFKGMVLHGRNQPVREFEKGRGWLALEGDHNRLLFASKYFWQYHPKVLACDARQVEFLVWSKLEDLPDPEIGFAKTHEVALQLGGPEEELDPESRMAALHCPLRAVTAPDHYVAADVFGTTSPADRERFPHIEDHLLRGAQQAEEEIKAHNLYGVRDFGDTYGTRFDVTIAYNQEYDHLLGAALQFARTADCFYLDRADALAWHFVDVDVLHASNSPLNELGQHMHFTDHAKGETHAGHCTVEGLWHYYMLTGEPRVGEVARGTADYFAKVAAWKDFLDFRDDEERTIGWALRALVPSYSATLDPRYKLAAQMVVEQAIAGQDPDTGNWDHPLYPNEDKHRPTCVGGKPWMVGIIVEGMKKYHRAFDDPRVNDLILKATDWIIASNYVYMTCKDHEPREGGLHHLTALTYAWELSGERFYLDEALRIFAHLTAPWTGPEAGGGPTHGAALEELANVLRIIGEQGEAVWKDNEPVLEPGSAPIVEAMRADPKFRARPSRRF